MSKSIFFVIILLFWSFCGSASNEDLNQVMQNGYPKTRYITSTYSLLFGTMAIWKGLTFVERQTNSNITHLGEASILIGSLRIIDGLKGIIWPYEAEVLHASDKLNNSETLARVSNRSLKWRVYRSSLIAANSALFFALYFSREPTTEVLIYPATIMGAVSILNLTHLSPEEEAYRRIKNKIRVHLFPTQGGGVMTASLNF